MNLGELLLKAGRLAEADKVGADLAQELRGHKYVNGGGPREMVFAGLTQGVNGAGFSPFARKLVVHIGDMGDKSEPKDIKHAREVASHFKKGTNSPVEFISIQVLNPDLRGFDPNPIVETWDIHNWSI